MSDNFNHGSWGEYQKLVLAELERHNKWLSAIDTKLNQTLLTFGLQKQAIEILKDKVEELSERIDELEEESISLEDQKLIYTSLKDLKEHDDRVIGGLKIAAVIVPIVSVLLAALVDVFVSGKM